MKPPREARDLLKVLRTIESCVTFDQLSVASKMVEAYELFYLTDSGLFGYVMDKRTQIARNYAH